MRFLFSSFKEMSIRTRIFVFYAVILMISLSIFAFFTIKTSNEAIVAKATKNAERELALISNSLLNLTNNSEDYVRILAIDNRLQMQLERIRNGEMTALDHLEVKKALSTAISKVVHPNSYVAAASIMSDDRTLFDVGFVDNSSVYPILTEDVIETITKGKTPAWLGLNKIKYQFGGGEDNVFVNAFVIAKTIIGFDTGNILGTAILYLNEENVASIYLDNIVNQDDKFYIIDNENNILSTRDKNELYKKFDEKKYLGKYKLEELSNTNSIINDIDGKQSLITVQPFDKLKWKIISIIPLDEIIYEKNEMTKLIVFVGCICLIFAFIASYLLSYTISRPILKLVNIMKEIKSGNMKLRANLNTKGEIGMLGDGFNSLMDRINNLLEQIYIQQKSKRENEFKLLQSQIKPHFLYNTIETIISFIKLDMKDKAMLTAKNLAGFYRISLSKGKDIISIEEEMKLINNYLSIQKLRYIEYLDYKIDFEDRILKYQIPKLTLQPLVENSIYHGLKEKEEKGNLSIKGYYEQDTIKIEVFDDGVGMTVEQIRSVLNPPPKDKKSTEFGLYNVDARLKLLYGNQYGITIDSRVGEYTKVIVTLPANEY